MIIRLFILLFFFTLCQSYELPPVMIEALRPRGLRVSIKDDGFSRFVFQGILNDESDGVSGPWLGVVNEPVNGTWTYLVSWVDLSIGDKLYYSVHVSKGGEGYEKEGEFVVMNYVDNYRFDYPTTNPPRTTINAPCDVSLSKVEGYLYTCRDELLFSEDFDKISVHDLQEWYPENLFPEGPDYSFNIFQNNNDSIKMEGGSLVITAIALDEINHVLDFSDRCSSQSSTKKCQQSSSGNVIVPPVVSAKITTKYSFNFMFGRIEISAKLPAGDWLIPELILEPRYAAYGSEHYESGIMRVAYTRGGPTTHKKLYGGPVLSDAEPYRSYFLRETVGAEEWHKHFHNYSLIWKPDGIELFVDGNRYGTVSPGFSISGREYDVLHAEQWVKKTPMTPLDEFFYISLALRVGGVNDFPDSPDKPWKNKGTKAILDFWKNRTTWLPSWNSANLQVDYVRVYAL